MKHKMYHFETNCVGFRVASIIYYAEYDIIIMCGTNLEFTSSHTHTPLKPLTPQILKSFLK